MATCADAIGAARRITSGCFRPGTPPLGNCILRLQRLTRTTGAIAVIAATAMLGGLIARVCGVAAAIPNAALTTLALLALIGTAVAWIGAGAGRWLEILRSVFDASPAAHTFAGANAALRPPNPVLSRRCGDDRKIVWDGMASHMTSAAATAALDAPCSDADVDARAAAAVSLPAGERPHEVEIEMRSGAGVREPLICTSGASAAADAAAVPFEAIATPRRQLAAGALPDPGLRPFFAEAPVGIAVVDERGQVRRVNRALGELFGAAPETLIGQSLIGLLNPQDQAALATRLELVAAGEDDNAPLEIRLASPRERTMVLLLRRFAGSGDECSCGAASSARHPFAFALYFIDVTEQKHLEAQFAQSQKMQAVGQLAGGVAHDFNNLLTAMIGFCDLLLLRSRPGDPAFADIMQIKQNANRAANLVRQLLAFSRQQSLQPRVLDLTEVLAELAHLLRRLIGENIELEFVHGRDLGLVKVDQGQLEQVVINLAVNARDAMPEGGRLAIRTENRTHPQPLRRAAETMPAGEYVLIEVADTGIGITPDILARIFEPFFSTKQVGSGTGLGLSTVYGIVKQTGGFVFVDSVPGQGTTFSIYLPRHLAAEAPLGDAAEFEPAMMRDLTGHATILFVEDDDAVRMFGARALRNKGYRVIEAASGEAALDTIRAAADPIDLVITDVVMPRIDGPALVRELREIDCRIKVIFISGYAEDAFRRRLDQEHDIHFLPKPFNLKQLALTVKEVLRSEQQTPQLPDCVTEQTGYTSRSAARCMAASAVK